MFSWNNAYFPTARVPWRCSFNIFFSAAAKQNSSASRAAAKKAGKLMSQFGVAPDRVTINAQIDYAIKQGRPDEAIETFERALDGVSKPVFQKRWVIDGSFTRPVVHMYCRQACLVMLLCLPRVRIPSQDWFVLSTTELQGTRIRRLKWKVRSLPQSPPLCIIGGGQTTRYLHCRKHFFIWE